MKRNNLHRKRLFDWWLSSGGDTAFSSFAQFLEKSPPAKYASNPIILHDATYTNICPGSSPIEDPQDSSKLLMYVGEFQGNNSVNARVAVYRADKSNIYSWARVGTFLEKGINDTFHDENGVRFGNAVVHEGTIYYFYNGQQGSGNGSQAICLATSTDGVTANKVAVVLEADQVEENNFTDPFVFIDPVSGVWYMYVSAKTTVPVLGIAIATSDDLGMTWTKTGTMAVELGAARSFDDKYIEGCSVFYTGSDYVMLYTCSSSSNVWSISTATAASPNATFTKHTVPWFQHALSGWDGGSVAVEFPYQVGSRWYIFYQGTTQFQPADTWDIGVAELLPDPEVFPAGFITGRGLWTGQYFFDTQDAVTVGVGDRSVRALDNTGFGNALADVPISIVAGADSNLSLVMRCTTVSGTFRGGIYFREGANVITGIYFHSGTISHLRSAGWTALQVYAANTNYTIEVRFTSKVLYTVLIGGVAIASNQTPFTAITTAIDTLRLEKAQQSTSNTFFGDMAGESLGVPFVVDIGQI